MTNYPKRYDPANPVHENFREVSYPDEAVNAHSYDVNDLQGILGHRIQGLGDALFKDGDVISGGAITIDAETGDVSIPLSQIYIQGWVYTVPAASFTIATVGAVFIGIAITSTYVTPTDLIDLKGAIAGTRAFGQKGAHRLRKSAAFGTDGDPFFPIWEVRDGVIIELTPPPQSNTYNSQLARYDREAHGHYVVKGFTVRALGLSGSDQVFSIDAGTINVWGYKITREAGQRFLQAEDPTLANIEAEPHTAAGGAGEVVPLNHTPAKAINQVTVTREVVDEPLTRGVSPNTADALAQTSVASIVEVKQGGTTYVAGTDYTLTADQVNWAPGGIEPATGSSYTVTYRYLDTLDAGELDAWDADSITLSGALAGSTIIVDYDWALPRKDALALDRQGAVVYIKGQSARTDPWVPRVPAEMAKIAEVTNNWATAPAVANVPPPAMHFNALDAMRKVLYDVYDYIAQERLGHNATSRERLETRGLMVDPFLDDDIRDAGVTGQGLAVVDETLRLPIAPLIDIFDLGDVQMLPHTVSTVVAQEKKTGTSLINPYAAFAPMPARLSVRPAVDFWTESAEVWLSDRTRNIVTGFGREELSSSTSQQIDQLRTTTTRARFLREIELTVTIAGFGAGEVLDELTFDGLDVTPAGTPTADGSGNLTVAFDIPANVPAGSKRIVATGAGGTIGRAMFVGQGTIATRVMQRVFTTRVTRGETVVEQAWRPQREFDGGDGSNDGTGYSDPLAQTVTLGEARQIADVQFKFSATGSLANPVVVQVRETSVGLPTGVVIAETVLDMAAVTLDAWTTAEFANPVYFDPGTEYALVFMTDDNVHAMHLAEIGKFDVDLQEWVVAQPYQVGVMLSSSNASTWTPHQREDLTFRLRAADYSSTSIVVAAGTVDLVDATDLLVLVPFEEPSADTTVRVRATLLTSGDVYTVLPGQPIAFTARKTEQATIELLLSGTANLSPVVYPFVQVIQGEQSDTDFYQSRAVACPAADNRVIVTFDGQLPSGSTAVIEIGDGTTWTTVASPATLALADGWVEFSYQLDDYNLANARVKITLNGTPAARPRIRKLRMNVTPDPASIV